jgi:chromosome segregation ATPase
LGVDQQEFQSMALEQFRIINVKHEQFQTMVIEQFRLIREELVDIHAQISINTEGIRSIKSELAEMRSELGEIRSELRELRHDLRSVESRVNELYNDWNKVKVKFGLEWIAASFFIAVVASGITLVFGHK